MSKLIRLFLLSFFLLALAVPVFAQDAEFRVHAQRQFGYGNGSDVRGSFALTIYGAQESIQSVTYLIDGKEMGTVTAAPFKFGFNTSDYPLGIHALSAVVSTKDNRKVTTPEIRLNFVSNAQEGEAMSKILVPLLGGVLLVTVIGVGAQILITRRGDQHLTPGAPRSYGFKGGTICPRCGRAYAIHFFSINLIGGCIDRCDYCGKWAFVRSRSRADLDAAVLAESISAQASESSLPGVQANGKETEEERLRRMMDESKYVG